MTVDRRTSPRLAVSRPAKLRCPQTGLRYLPGRTCNVSASGALVEFDPAPVLTPGQTIELAIAPEATAGLLRPEHVVTATVVRSLAHGRRRYVAVRFAQPVPLAQAG